VLDERVAVNKMTLTGVACVAAIPAAVVTFLMVMVFLQHTDKASGVMLALVGITMLASAAVALMPVGIFVLSGSKPGQGSEGADNSKKAAAAAAATMEVKAEYEATGEFEPSGEFVNSTEFEVNTGEFEIDEDDFGESEVFDLDEESKG